MRWVNQHEIVKKFRQIFYSLSFLLLLFSSCMKEPIIVDQEKTMKELVVPDGFNFDMVISIPIFIQLPTTVSYSSVNRIIEIWNENADGRPGKMIKTGSADNNGIYEASIIIPVTTKKILTNCFAGWRTITLQGDGLKLTDGVFTIDYNVGYGKALPRPMQGNQWTPPNGVKIIRNVLKTGIENVLKNGDFSANKFGKMDKWSSPIEVDGLWYATDEAINYGSIISEEGNSFARINSEKYSAGGFTQLIQANSGQVVTFSGDTRGFDSQQDVYLFLVPRNQYGEFIDVFSYNLVNPGITWVNGTIVGSMPEGTVACQVLFYKGSTGIVDFDNAVVHVNALDSDRDGDGVLDWEDNYPDNPGQAFDDFYPAKDKPGTYAFEDLWPSQGDYDFNDLIVDYQINRISNGKNQVVEIDVITQVRAIGGSIRNGFGMQIYLSPDMITGIKADYEFLDDAIKLNENGTEMGQKWATFIFFTDAYNLLSHPGDGSPGINTTLGYHYVIPSEKNLRIFLKEPVDPEKVNLNNFNPFIFRAAERSHEIHLRECPPTDLANPKLFGTGNDVSNPESGIFYQTKNGMPWAINVPVQFEYTIEKAEILKGYPAFAKWISSGGKEFEDWYLDKQGYRNWDNIYRW